MSDLSGAMLISGDLAFYRMMDAYNESRAKRAANAEIAHAWAWSDELVRRFNAVVEAYNMLVKQGQAYERDCNARLVELQRRIVELERENAELRNTKAASEAGLRANVDCFQRLWEAAEKDISRLHQRIARLEGNANI